MGFRSQLEEKVADLLVELGVSYDYEDHKLSYTIQHLYTPDFVLPNGVIPVSYTHLTLPTNIGV